MNKLSLFWISLLLFIIILFIIRGSLLNNLISVEGMESGMSVSGEKKTITNVSSVDV